MTRITEDTQEMVELLPCPFCDGAPEAVQRLTEVAIICSTPDCMARQNAPNAKWAADKWNHRTASQLASVVGERDALREALEGAADELKSCAEQFRALKMTTCAQYTEAQEAKVREALSPNQGAKL